MHSVVFARLEECLACAAAPDRSELVELAEPIVPPKGCASSEQHERSFMRVARIAEEMVEKLLPPPRKRKGKGIDRRWGKVNFKAAAALLDVAIKATRAAAEHTATRERREHVRRLERRATALKSRGRN